MLFSVLGIIFGAGILASLSASDGDEAEAEAEVDDISDGTEGVPTAFFDFSDLPTKGDDLQPKNGDPALEPLLNLQEESEILDEHVVAAPKLFLDYLPNKEFEIDIEVRSPEISPLEDWSENVSIQKHEIDSEGVVRLESPQGGYGSFIVQEAHYYENLESKARDAVDLQLGANIYFVPEHTSFPEEYIWSEEGAGLFNGETFHNEAADFSDISFVARIDFGSVDGSKLDGLSSDELQTVIEEMMPSFLSNSIVVFRN